MISGMVSRSSGGRQIWPIGEEVLGGQSLTRMNKLWPIALRDGSR